MKEDIEFSLSILAKRVGFAQKMIDELKRKYPIKKFKLYAEISGPAFEKLDLNLRFVTPQSPNYESELKQVYEKNFEDFQKKALIMSLEELKAKKYGNLYLNKFIPFLGFRLEIETCADDQIEKSIIPKVLKQ
jgi:hypothetical protein